MIRQYDTKTAWKWFSGALPYFTEEDIFKENYAVAFNINQKY